jgi:hypothetical protein
LDLIVIDPETGRPFRLQRLWNALKIAPNTYRNVIGPGNIIEIGDKWNQYNYSSANEFTLKRNSTQSIQIIEKGERA